MKTIAVALALAVTIVATSLAQDGEEREPSDANGFKLSLVPTAFQRNPEVRFNVITEVTVDGRKAPRPTAENPAYYIIRPMGYLKLGQDARKAQEAPPVGLMLERMREALANNGYVAASSVEDPISLIILVDWGLFSGAVRDDGEESAENSDDMLDYVLRYTHKMEELVERASFVGGVRFAGELREALRDELIFQRSAASGQRLRGFQESLGGPAFMGAPLAARGFRPIVRFKNRNLDLFERSFRSFYFVVASAFDQARAAEGERVLLWQTKMTVDTDGVSLAETLNPLILSAAPYFGRDMTKPIRTIRRIDREGSVEMAPIEVIDTVDDRNASDSRSEASEPSPSTTDER